MVTVVFLFKEPQLKKSNVSDENFNYINVYLVYNSIKRAQFNRLFNTVLLNTRPNKFYYLCCHLNESLNGWLVLWVIYCCFYFNGNGCWCWWKILVFVLGMDGYLVDDGMKKKFFFLFYENNHAADEEEGSL